MPSYHVHVYRVIGKYEKDIDAQNDVEASSKALDMVQSEELELLDRDCDLIAMIPSIDSEEVSNV